MTDGEEDEISALTPEPASTKGWTQRDWALHYREHAKALHARIVELHAEAGIEKKVERLEQGSLFPHIDHRPYNPKAHEAEVESERNRLQRGLRRLYFSVEDETLRKRLIRLDRAESTAALNFHQAENRADHHELAVLEARGAPWATAASVEAVVVTLAGALVGHAAAGFDAVRTYGDGVAMQIGAIAGAAVGVVRAIRQRDLAEEARRRTIADAREQLAANDRIFQSILDEPETFTGWEEHTGKPDDLPEA